MLPKILYHYTSVDALNGIITQNEYRDNILRFWCTEHNFMNDPKEIIRGRELVKKQLISKINNPELKKELLDSYLSEKAVYYILSLSNKADILPMWSTYGQNGTGICLELDTTYIENREYDISKCAYSAEELLQQINSAIIAKTDKEQRSLCLEIAPNSMLLKPPYYSYENEYRIMFLISHREKWLKPKLRLNRGIIAHFIEYEIPIKALKSIIIGPNNNMRKVGNSIQQYLQYRGVENVRIKYSKIPYKTR